MAARSAPEARSETEHARGPRREAAGVRIDLGLCKACGICVALCPVDVFEADAKGVPVVARLDACTVCRFCERHCPDFAIEVEAAGLPATSDRAPARDAAAPPDLRRGGS